MSNVTVYYNPPSRDAFAAAYAVSLVYPDASFIEVSDVYNITPSDASIIYILDCKVKVESLREVAKTSKVFLITHKENLVRKSRWENIPNLTILQEDTKSTCVLTWESLFSDPPPKLFYYIQDHELFRFKMNHSRSVYCYLETVADNFGALAHASNMLDIDLAYVRLMGTMLLRQHDLVLNEQLKQSFEIDTKLGPAAFVNATHHRREVGQLMPLRHPSVDYTGVFFIDKKGKLRITFRSTKIDVSDLARTLGGDGSPHVAGAVVPFSLEELFKVLAG